MNKIAVKNRMFVVLFLLLLASLEIKAQTYEFAPVGAEWYYTRFYKEGWNMSGIACDRFTSVRTVEINGLECKEIELYRHLDCDGVVNPYSEFRYVHQDGNRVYEVDNGELYLLYDFSKGPGEYWVVPKYNDTIFVKNVSYITLDDGTLRQVLEIWKKPDCLWWFSDVIEGIGMEESLFPQIAYDGASCIPGGIRCYFENGVQLISSETLCDYEVLSVEEDYEKPLATINTLVEDVLHVTFDENRHSPKTILIYDNKGFLVYKAETIGNSIDISFDDKPSGMYLLRVSSLTNIMNVKFVKK